MRRWGRRVLIVYLTACAACILFGAVSAVANAATGHATPVNFLDQVPVPFLAALIGANVIPYLSALATKKPGWWTGAVTVVLALLDAVVAAVAHAGNDDWRHVAAVTVGAWVVARLHLKTFLKGTKVEAELHSRGYTGRHRTATDTGSVEPRSVFLGCALLLVLVLLLTGHWVLALVAGVVCGAVALIVK